MSRSGHRSGHRLGYRPAYNPSLPEWVNLVLSVRDWVDQHGQEWVFRYTGRHGLFATINDQTFWWDERLNVFMTDKQDGHRQLIGYEVFTDEKGEKGEKNHRFLIYQNIDSYCYESWEILGTYYLDPAPPHPPIDIKSFIEIGIPCADRNPGITGRAGSRGRGRERRRGGRTVESGREQTPIEPSITTATWMDTPQNAASPVSKGCLDC